LGHGVPEGSEIVKRLLTVIALIGLTSAVPRHAQAAVGFSIYVSNAPPPPRVIFERAPRFVLVPEDEVYVVDDPYCDYDVFRYGPWYYLYDEGYWYRSRSYGGPFLAIQIDYVPRPIFHVGSYGYYWRDRPRYVTSYIGPRTWRSRYSAQIWDSSYRNWRDTRYRQSDYGDRRYSQPRREPIRQWGDRNPDWSDRRDVGDRGAVEQPSDRDVRSRGDRDQGDQGQADQGRRDNSGRGHGKGHDRGNSKGHGRGHGDGGDD
jgi:hypothetical protein